MKVIEFKGDSYLVYEDNNGELFLIPVQPVNFPMDDKNQEIIHELYYRKESDEK